MGVISREQAGDLSGTPQTGKSSLRSTEMLFGMRPWTVRGNTGLFLGVNRVGREMSMASQVLTLFRFPAS